MGAPVRLSVAAWLVSMPIFGIEVATAHAEPQDGSNDRGSISRADHPATGQGKDASRPGETKQGWGRADKDQPGRGRPDKDHDGSGRPDKGWPDRGWPDRGQSGDPSSRDCHDRYLAEELQKLLASLFAGGGQSTGGSQPTGSGGGIIGRTVPTVSTTPKFGDGRSGVIGATGSASGQQNGTSPGPATVAVPLGAGIGSLPLTSVGAGISPAGNGQPASLGPENPVASQPTLASPVELIALALQPPSTLPEHVHGIAELPALRPYPLDTNSAAQQPGGPDQSGHLYRAGNRLPVGPVFRPGYTDYLRSAGLDEVATVAVTGITGIVVFTIFGGLIGYRQARAGHMVHAGAGARFLS
ncbi:hypothetical protein [Mycobacterium sp. OTB74]|uniref:hypothetical protein n=1 Tax=Mycobacterium sp. OTB74 TaxID=1853452 RepID=UPI002473A8A9|nr:hypothetical protein [Mycobacterium sp. OTB74]MDH6244888.1 hypothetical protein [Mycobacterium sp. OTB74]